MPDIVIKNGRIADGTGSASFVADVAIENGIIVQIAPNISAPANRVLDAKGFWVTPGFIDCHNHSDDCVFFGTDSYNSLEQGVTTQIVGNCGMSSAPYYEGAMMQMKRQLDEAHFAQICQQSQTMSSFMSAACNATIGTNMAFFVGHNNLRGKNMGFSAEKATPAQLHQMQDDLIEAMEAGCLGFSSGLVYAPSVYADTQELVTLARTIAPYGGIYATHIRGEASRVLEAVKEAIYIGSEAGVQVQLSHLKVIGKDRVGMAQQLLQLMEDAHRQGIKVYADQYPYVASSAQLRALIPPQFHEGGVEALLQRLQDNEMRKVIEKTIYQQTDPFESGIRSAGWDGILLASLPKTPELVGYFLADLAREQGKAPMDLLCEILLANHGVAQGIYHNQHEDNMLRILAHPLVFAGTDSSNLPDDRVRPDQMGGRHPRGVAAMVRRLALQRDLGICTPEESIHRMTGAPATAFGLERRGILRVGYHADIAVLDYTALSEGNTYLRPYLPNRGIHYVLVNGTVAVEKGRANRTRAGKIIKKSAR